MENLVTDKFNSVLLEGKFIQHGGEVHCLAVTCEGCTYESKCNNEVSEIDGNLKTNVRRTLATSKSDTDREFIGDSNKVVLKEFKDKPFDYEHILYNSERENYICVSGQCKGCEFYEVCEPEVTIQESRPVIFSMDLKAQEPRAYAHFSSEPNWVKLFQNDSIRSTPYLYEIISLLFTKVLEPETDLTYHNFLNSHFFEDRTDIYNLVSSVTHVDTENFYTVSEYLLLLYAKDNTNLNIDIKAILDSLDFKDFQTLLGTEINHFPPVADFHGANAVAFFGEEVVKDAYYNDYAKFKDYYRAKAKSNGLALNYGGTFKVILDSIPGCTEPMAIKLHESYFSVLFVFKSFLDNLWKVALKSKHIKTMVGRRIFIPELAITDRKFMYKKYGSGKNNVSNYPIQGSSAEMIRIMLIKSYKFFTKGRMTKHDINYAAKTTQDSNILYVDSKLTEEELEELSSFIDDSPLGNCRILVTEGDIVTHRASRCIRVTHEDAKHFNLKEL